MYPSSTNRAKTNASYTGQPSRGDHSAYGIPSTHYPSSSSTVRQPQYSSNQASHVYTVASSHPQGYISQYDSSREYSSGRSGNHSHGHSDYAQPQSSNYYSQPGSFHPTLAHGQSAHSSQSRVYSSNAYDIRDQTHYPPPYSRSSQVESGLGTSSSGRTRTTAPSAQGHTRQSSSLSSNSSGGDRYSCTHCGKSFSRAHDRKRHEEGQHLSQARPVCPTCHKEFSRPDSLKRHRDNGCDAAEGRIS
ncbi:hypothetical protein CYLTODRAFT_174658 [Cylindrobasidium torrendii FP15055 ss-10]|uniref:C2H2-type domain-containing protein n=1 Tax=Cylindrobasidium torrendii FP15055 ss-10 TaxID=1314674 RepID=A0A0D7BKG9_9AGAR|nr:hypothetical protein CYLTODRAFT_174658 [Cylindrobasidium torrendii FP15055 ss-10]